MTCSIGLTNLNAEVVEHEQLEALPLSIKCLWLFLLVSRKHGTPSHSHLHVINAHWHKQRTVNGAIPSSQL